MSHLLELRKVSFGYTKDKLLFDELSLTFPHTSNGKVIAIMGPSGSGKSTLLKLMSGIIKPSSGDVLIDKGVRISYLPQEPVLFEHLSTIDNALYFKRIRSCRDKVLACKKSGQFDAWSAMLCLDFADLEKDCRSLSGGEVQRLVLLRALTVQPDILLLDEPCTGLPINIRMEFLSELRELSRKEKLVVFYVTHHSDELITVADEVLVLPKSYSNVDVSKLCLCDMFDNARSLDALLNVNFPVNVLRRCSIEASEEECRLIARINSENHVYNIDKALPDGRYTLVFRPECLVSGEGFPLSIVATNGAYVLLDDTEGARFYARDNTVNYTIDGQVWLFDEESEPGVAVNLSPTGKGE